MKIVRFCLGAPKCSISVDGSVVAQITGCYDNEGVGKILTRDHTALYPDMNLRSKGRHKALNSALMCGCSYRLTVGCVQPPPPVDWQLCCTAVIPPRLPFALSPCSCRTPAPNTEIISRLAAHLKPPISPSVGDLHRKHQWRRYRLYARLWRWRRRRRWWWWWWWWWCSNRPFVVPRHSL